MHTLPDATAAGAAPFDLRHRVLTTGTRRKVGNNTPMPLDDPQAIWIVMNGTINVFAVQRESNGAHGPREFLFRVETGQLLFGFPDSVNAQGVIMLAVGDADTVLASVTRDELDEALLAAEGATAVLLANYTTTVCEALTLDADTTVDGPWHDHVLALQQRAIEATARELMQRDSRIRSRLAERRALDESAATRAFSAIGTLLASNRGEHDTGNRTALESALRVIGDAVGVSFRTRVAEPHFGDLVEQARHIAAVSGVGCRQVRLHDGWWRSDAGPLLAFTERAEKDEHTTDASSPVPLVLLPAAVGYEVVQATTGARVPATAELAASLTPFALQFYRALPADAAPGALRRFVLQGLRAELPPIVRTSMAAAILALLPPVLTASLFDRVIPGADVRALGTVLLALLVAGLSGLLFEYARAVAVMRARTRLIHDLQLAILDRLFRLPVSFFRQYAAGDLGKRAMGISALGKDVGQYAVTTVFSAVAGCVALVLLFWFSVPLALLATFMLSLKVAATVVVARASLPSARTRQAVDGELSAFMLETLRGMSKLRVAAAESRVVSRWSAPFMRQQQAAFAFGLRALHLTSFVSVLDVVARIALFAAYAWMWREGSDRMGTGTFVAFAAAEGTLRASVVAASTTIIALLEQLPAWERVAPILGATPESRNDLPDPGVLEGNIQLRNVSFAYGSDAPRVLHDVSLDIPAGSFVAIVGPSGSGKSSLLRLLLGFEEPTAGSVLYDAKDLRLVDRIAVRRQIGVVLQNATLSNGDIYSNITGSTPRPQSVVWEAARLAGIADEIAAMPMGLLTLVPDGGSSLSGGQRQRLLIARALINGPRMLFLDEATSALDTRAQRHVSESIDTLRVTRVVIAHRLSTIRHADRIVVLDAGRIVDSGTYDELVARGGLFARLAAQQEA